jgi:uncharacterized protein YjbI with pentapeptide repeats
LSFAQLQFASLPAAQLQGAHLFDAQLQGASLSVAQLQGADLQQANLQGADLEGAQLQGADLSFARLHGANLSGAQLQGADLRNATLWNIHADDHTRLGLADLRGAHFSDVLAEDLLARLPTATPEFVKQRIRARLVARVGARTLPRQVDTTDGRILVTDPNGAAWRNLDRERQLTTETTDIDPALAKLLADTTWSSCLPAGKLLSSASNSARQGADAM